MTAIPDRDERTTHRLEAFSDIVIGFCMAELGLSLVIPKDVAGLASSWANLNVFAISFVLIALIWWWHHKFFLTYFTMNPVTIVMNFILLGSLVYCIYFQQVAIHFATTDVPVALPLRLWLSCMALSFALLAGMYTICIWERRRELDDKAMRSGVTVAYETTISAAGLAVIAAMIPTHPIGVVMTILIVALTASLGGALASRLTRLLFPAH